jgi:two-component sensor histidine kinase
MNECSKMIECQLVVEANHRIANHLAILASYVALRRREFSKAQFADDAGEILRLMDCIGTQVAAVSELHRMLTAVAFVDSGDLAAQLGRMCEAFQEGPGCGAVIEYTAETSCFLPVDLILPVLQIVSELVTNALKYGQKAGRIGTIRVSCLRVGDNCIKISVEDDGDGFLPGEIPTAKPKGIGAAMIAALAVQVEGTIEYRSSKTGTSFSLFLPSDRPSGVEKLGLSGQYDSLNLGQAEN